jgi:hypothetical protein
LLKACYPDALRIDLLKTDELMRYAKEPLLKTDELMRYAKEPSLLRRRPVATMVIVPFGQVQNESFYIRLGTFEVD